MLSPVGPKAWLQRLRRRALDVCGKAGEEGSSNRVEAILLSGWAPLFLSSIPNPVEGKYLIGVDHEVETQHGNPGP
jgi:hypothetical protein